MDIKKIIKNKVNNILTEAPLETFKVGDEVVVIGTYINEDTQRVFNFERGKIVYDHEEYYMIAFDKWSHGHGGAPSKFKECLPSNCWGFFKDGRYLERIRIEKLPEMDTHQIFDSLNEGGLSDFFKKRKKERIPKVGDNLYCHTTSGKRDIYEVGGIYKVREVNENNCLYLSMDNGCYTIEPDTHGLSYKTWFVLINPEDLLDTEAVFASLDEALSKKSEYYYLLKADLTGMRFYNDREYRQRNTVYTIVSDDNETLQLSWNDRAPGCGDGDIEKMEFIATLNSGFYKLMGTEDTEAIFNQINEARGEYSWLNADNVIGLKFVVVAQPNIVYTVKAIDPQDHHLILTWPKIKDITPGSKEYHWVPLRSFIIYLEDGVHRLITDFDQTSAIFDTLNEAKAEEGGDNKIVLKFNPTLRHKNYLEVMAALQKIHPELKWAGGKDLVDERWRWKNRITYLAIDLNKNRLQRTELREDLLENYGYKIFDGWAYASRFDHFDWDSLNEAEEEDEFTWAREIIKNPLPTCKEDGTEYILRLRRDLSRDDLLLILNQLSDRGWYFTDGNDSNYYVSRIYNYSSTSDEAFIYLRSGCHLEYGVVEDNMISCYYRGFKDFTNLFV